MYHIANDASNFQILQKLLVFLYLQISEEILSFNSKKRLTSILLFTKNPTNNSNKS